MVGHRVLAHLQRTDAGAGNMSGRRQKYLAVAAAVAAVALAAAGCSSSGSGSGSSSPSGQQAKAVKGGTATVGVISGAAPTWTWPFTPVSQSSVVNKQDFQWLLYRPLYMFGGNNNSVNVNYPLSTGNP